MDLPPPFPARGHTVSLMEKFMYGWNQPPARDHTVPATRSHAVRHRLRQKKRPFPTGPSCGGRSIRPAHVRKSLSYIAKAIQTGSCRSLKGVGQADMALIDMFPNHEFFRGLPGFLNDLFKTVPILFSTLDSKVFFPSFSGLSSLSASCFLSSMNTR